MEELISNLPEAVVVLVTLAFAFFVGPAARNALHAFAVAYEASELRKKLLEAVIVAKEQYETNNEVVEYVVGFIKEKYPNLEFDETELTQQILTVLNMLEKNLDVSRYISR